MMFHVAGNSKKITVLSGDYAGMVGHVSGYTAKELKAKYGKGIKIESMLKKVKKNLNGPVVNIPIDEYLQKAH